MVWGKGDPDHRPKTQQDIEKENAAKAKRIADYEADFKNRWGPKYWIINIIEIISILTNYFTIYNNTFKKYLRYIYIYIQNS